MKILHLNTERSWRGGEQQTLYLLQGLKDQNITSHLVCQPGSPLEKRARDAKIDTMPLGMRGEVDLRAICRLRALIRGSQYDILHCHTSHAHSLAFWASIGIGVQRLVTRRVDFSIFRHSFLRLSGLKYRLMADFYIAISEKIKEVLVGDGIAADRIFVVHSGIDPDRLAGSEKTALIAEFDIKSQEAVVINVAHLAGHKGQKYLLQAIPDVLRKIPDVRFFIIGDGELMPELKALAKSLGVNQKIVFAGFRQDVGAFYQLADLFVMSSIAEGLGTAVLDALALGIPVVATRAGGIPEIICDAETGRLVPPADPPALANAILEVLGDRQAAQRMADKGYQMVRNNFSVEKMVAKNIAVYRQILMK